MSEATTANDPTLFAQVWAEREQLRAERDELREALERCQHIARNPMTFEDSSDALDRILTVATAALANLNKTDPET